MAQHIFSKNSKYLASISDTGGLKVWDTETQLLKHDYVPNQQTSAPCTSLIWVTLEAKRSNGRQDFIVLGTRKGSVAIFSLSSGKIESTLKGTGHAGAITGMCFDDDETVYTAGEDGKVIVWSLSTGAQNRSWDLGNERPTAIALSLDKKKLITASRQIKLWTIKTNECKQTYTGHASSVHFLNVVQFEDTEYLVSGSNLNRVLSVWSLRATSKKKDSLATFSLEDVPVFLDALCKSGTLSLLAVCRNNVAYHYLEKMDELITSVKPVKHRASVSVVAEKKATASAKQLLAIPTIAAALTDLSKVFLAYGNTLSLKFEEVRLQRGKKSEVLIRKDPRKIYTKSETSGAHLGLVEPIVDAAQVEYSMILPARKALKPNEIRIEKRLENLSLVKGDAIEHTSAGTNMTQLLIQGLHSNDKTILNEIFSITDNHSVRSTLQKLPPQYIGSLINELTTLMQQKIDHIETGVGWMKALLQTHTSQLMALGADELMNRFGPCMGIIEHRVNNLKNLNRIKGRLDLLLNQMDDHPSVDIIETPNDHLLVYQDESEESADEGDHMNGSCESSEEEPEKMNGLDHDSSGGSEDEENMLTDGSRQSEEDDDDESD